MDVIPDLIAAPYLEMSESIGYVHGLSLVGLLVDGGADLDDVQQEGVAERGLFVLEVFQNVAECLPTEVELTVVETQHLPLVELILDQQHEVLYVGQLAEQSLGAEGVF